MQQSLHQYISAESAELHRIFNEVKWYVGEELGRDPRNNPEDMMIVNERFAGVILSGAGAWLADKFGGGN